MQFIISLVIIIICTWFLSLIDRKIKGDRSIISKICSLLIVGTFLYLSVYFYGRQILESFNVNAKSFTNVKLFFSSRVIAMIAVLLLFLSCAIKIFFLSIKIKSNSIVLFSRKEITIALAIVVLDMLVVPNIIGFILVTLFGIGLTFKKLVFSNFKFRIKEISLC